MIFTTVMNYISIIYTGMLYAGYIIMLTLQKELLVGS